MPSSDSDIADAYLAEAKEQIAKATEVIRHCLEQLTDEQLAWRPSESMNSVGTLVLHLCGNLRQWIVSGVGGETDVRDRPQEFAGRGPFRRDDLARCLDEMVGKVNAALSTVEASQLLGSCRIQGFETTELSAVFDSVAHFKGHTQEIVCFTRMQLGDGYRFEWAPSTPEEGAPSRSAGI